MVLRTVAQGPGGSLCDAVGTVKKELYKFIEPTRVIANIVYNPVTLGPGVFLNKGLH
jgi:hypothetical protein